MAEIVTVIGRNSFVRGRVSGSGSLEIAGRIEGDVSVSGDLTVDTTGLVAANISGRRLTLRGAIKGDVNATEAIVLEAGARVVGDLNAPRVAIAEGALVRGHVTTGAAGNAKPRAASSAASRPAQPAAQASRKAPPPPPPARKAPPAPPSDSRVTSRNPLPRGSVLAGTRPAAKSPPAPVVPVLKKGAKATQKKRG